MSKEAEKPKEDTEIVFLKPHRHRGVDYKADDVVKVTSDYTEKLIKRDIAKLSQLTTAVATKPEKEVKA